MEWRQRRSWGSFNFLIGWRKSQDCWPAGDKNQRDCLCYHCLILNSFSILNEISPLVNIKGLVAGCHSFCLFFIYFIHTYIHSITIHSSVSIRWSLSPFHHRLYAQWGRPPCGAEPRIELAPALQQADALPTEPRRTSEHYLICSWVKFVAIFGQNQFCTYFNEMLG